MDGVVTNKINEQSEQSPLPPQLKKKLTDFHIERILFYDVPHIDEEKLFDFCSKFDYFGNDTSRTRCFIQHYIIASFFKELAGMQGLSVEQAKIPKNKRGVYSLTPEDNGFSTLIKGPAKDGKQKILEDICRLEGLYRIKKDQRDTIFASYCGSLRNWRLAYTPRFGEKISQRYTKKSKNPHLKLDKTDRAKGDRFNFMLNILGTLFPQEYKGIIFPFSRKQFEKQAVRNTPIVHMLGIHPQMYLLLHTLDWEEMDMLGKKLTNKYFAINPPPVKQRTTADWRIEEFIDATKSSLKKVKNIVLEQADEFTYSLEEHLKRFDRRNVPFHPNRWDYVRIMKKVPRDFKSQRGNNSFLYNNFLLPLKRIMKAIDKSKGQNKYDILSLPPLEDPSPYGAMDSAMFPYNFPHIYLRGLLEHVKKFRGENMDELETYAKEWIKEIQISPSKRDIYARGRRTGGSFEKGKKSG